MPSGTPYSSLIICHDVGIGHKSNRQRRSYLCFSQFLRLWMLHIAGLGEGQRWLYTPQAYNSLHRTVPFAAVINRRTLSCHLRQWWAHPCLPFWRAQCESVIRMSLDLEPGTLPISRKLEFEFGGDYLFWFILSDVDSCTMALKLPFPSWILGRSPNLWESKLTSVVFNTPLQLPSIRSTP